MMSAYFKIANLSRIVCIRPCDGNLKNTYYGELQQPKQLSNFGAEVYVTEREREREAIAIGIVPKFERAEV